MTTHACIPMALWRHQYAREGEVSLISYMYVLTSFFCQCCNTFLEMKIQNMEFLPYGSEFGRDFGVELITPCHHKIFELSLRAVKKTIWSHLNSLQLVVAITVFEAIRRYEANNAISCRIFVRDALSRQIACFQFFSTFHGCNSCCGFQVIGSYEAKISIS